MTSQTYDKLAKVLRRPENHETYRRSLNVGMKHYRKGNFDDARPFLTAAYNYYFPRRDEDSEEFFQSALGMGMLEKACSNITAACGYLTLALQYSHAAADYLKIMLYIHLAEVLNDINESESALNYLTQARKLFFLLPSKQQQLSQHQLGEIYLIRGRSLRRLPSAQNAKALVCLEKSLNCLPKNSKKWAEAHWEAGLTRLDDRQYENALSDLLDAWWAFDGFSDPVSEHSKVTLSGLMGTCFFHLSQWDEAIHWLNEHGERSNDASSPLHDQLTALLIKGICHFRSGNISQAEADITLACSCYPETTVNNTDREKIKTIFKNIGISDLLTEKKLPLSVRDMLRQVIRSLNKKHIDPPCFSETGDTEDFSPSTLHSPAPTC